MYILIDWGGYAFKNVGDTAMLQVAIRRIQKRYPAATLHVVAHPDQEAALAASCPGTRLVSSRDRGAFFTYRTPVHGLDRQFPGVTAAWDQVWPGSQKFLGRAKARFRNEDLQPFIAYEALIRRCSLVIAAGGGYLNDSFLGHALPTLYTLNAASRYGIPTAVLGQGIGPVENKRLQVALASTLPGIDVVALREGRLGPMYMSKAKVDEDHVYVTGDDAISLSASFRPDALGSHVGLNLRLASYSNVTHAQLESVKVGLVSGLSSVAADLVPVPISFNRSATHAADIASVQEVLRGTDLDLTDWTSPETPAAVLQQVSGCRIVVTGSYHGAVFALAQGIPAVCVVASDYYAAKFGGCADLFGEGVYLVDLRRDDSIMMLSNAIRSAWEAAPERRTSLLRAADDQIQASRDAYEAVFAYVDRYQTPNMKLAS